MKKIHFFLCVIFSLLTLAICAQTWAAVIKVDSVRVPSEQAFVDIPIETTVEKDFSGYQLTLNYNSSILRATGVSKGNVASAFSLISNINRPGTIKAGGFDPGLNGVSGSGTLLNITFEILKSGTSHLSLSGVMLSDKEGKNLQVSVVNGKIDVEGKPSDNPAEETQPAEIIPEKQNTVSPAGTISSSIEKPIESVPQDRAERAKILRERISERATAKMVRETPAVQPGMAQTSESPASGNLILFIQSEYGNPFPLRGYSTHRKGSTVTCEIEKEIFVSEMEKAVCKGFRGKGSVTAGNTNKVSFQISQDTTLTWLWQKTSAGKDFILEIKPAGEMEDELAIPLKAIYYGGLRLPIKLTIYGLPESIEATLAQKEITYEQRENSLLLKRKSKIPPGEYRVKINASCGSVKKDYDITILVHGKIKKSVTKKEGSLSITLQPEKNIEITDSFRMALNFPANMMKLNKVLPESLSYKMWGKDILAVAGNFNEKPINISFEIQKPSTDIFLNIDSLIVLDKNGKKIPVRISEE
ncbi:MAG TPA: cohesin domain-containing protein [bacterium]|nr:cohesin domain-containing protein [bacterium]